MTRFSFRMIMAGLYLFCLSIIGWAGLGIMGYDFAGTLILQAGLMLMAVLVTSGLVIHYFDEKQKRRY